jgi:hypothetical protein
MPLALTIVACILFLICALFPPYAADKLPGRLIPLGLFFATLAPIWGKF